MSTSNSIPQRSAGVAYAVGASWLSLVVVAAWWSMDLDSSWPEWRTGLWAVAGWGLNLLLVYFLIGPPFGLSRVPMLSVVFALLMTMFGSASYWATTQLFPSYRVFIERAA